MNPASFVVVAAGLLAPQEIAPERKVEKAPLPNRDYGRPFNNPPPPKAGEITGVIVDLENWPVRRAKVTIEGVGTADGDPLGVFSIPVTGEPRLIDLAVSVDGFAPTLHRGVRTGESVRIAVRRLGVPERVVDGSVVDESGAPIAGARVYWKWKLDPPFEGEMTTDSDGAIRGVGFPCALRDAGAAAQPELTLEIVAEGFAPRTLRRAGILRKDPYGPSCLQVVLSRGVPVRGRVVDGRSGTAIPRAAVRLVFKDGPPPYAKLETVADVQGEFEFEHVPAQPEPDPRSRRGAVPQWQHVWLVASAEGYAMEVAHDFKLAPEASERAFEVRCFPACTIRGRVVDRNGAPVARVRICGGAHANWLYEQLRFETRSIAISDLDGRYELTDVTTGSTRENVTGQMETLNGWTDLPSGASIWVAHQRRDLVDAPVMTIDPLPSVFLRVVDPEGAPIAGASVAYERVASPRSTADANGRCTFRLPPPFRDGFRPVQPILVSAPGYAPFRAPDGKAFIETLDPQVETRVVLEPERRLRGRVTRADPDDPHARGTILVFSDDTAIEAVRDWFAGVAPPIEPLGTATLAPQDGWFEVRGLPSGRCLVVFSGRGIEFLEHAPTDSRDLQWTVTDEPEERDEPR